MEFERCNLALPDSWAIRQQWAKGLGMRACPALEGSQSQPAGAISRTQQRLAQAANPLTPLVGRVGYAMPTGIESTPVFRPYLLANHCGGDQTLIWESTSSAYPSWFLLPSAKQVQHPSIHRRLESRPSAAFSQNTLFDNGTNLRPPPAPACIISITFHALQPFFD